MRSKYIVPWHVEVLKFDLGGNYTNAKCGCDLMFVALNEKGYYHLKKRKGKKKKKKKKEIIFFFSFCVSFT